MKPKHNIIFRFILHPIWCIEIGTLLKLVEAWWDSDITVDQLTKASDKAKEFNATRWRVGMQAIYMGNTYRIVSVNFPERLLGLAEEHETRCDDPLWVRYENAEVQSPVHQPKTTVK